jgi:hypothetical protein
MAKNSLHHCFVTSVRISNIFISSRWAKRNRNKIQDHFSPHMPKYIPKQDKDKVVVAHTMKAYMGIEVQFHSFLVLMLSGHEWSAS